MSSVIIAAMVSSSAVFLLSELCQDEPVLDTTAALEHIFVVCIRISFADNVRTSELEFWRQASLAGPFDIGVSV